MRISFDVDDTLVCVPALLTENVVPWWGQPFFNEKLRLGTRGLMKELTRRNHRLWIYTTSLRSPSYLRTWFWSMGIPLEGVVNQDRHFKVVGMRGPSKLPSAFGIDLHIDDSEGVGMEGRQHGFEVLVISPDDPEWVKRVLERVG